MEKRDREKLEEISGDDWKIQTPAPDVLEAALDSDNRITVFYDEETPYHETLIEVKDRLAPPWLQANTMLEYLEDERGYGGRVIG